MTDTVREDMLFSEAGLGLSGAGDSELQALVDVIAGHRVSFAIGQ